ncbi:MAG: aminoacyl-histidine dipeptidase [Bacteroidaceae bacterium]
MSEIKNLEPKCLWRNFDALTQVPRPSGHLDAVRDFLVKWAQNAGVEVKVDNAGNVVLHKSATPGMENRQVVTLQAHMDMVPQKAEDSNHNFETDPIQTYIDGDWLKAKGTTLGADDGMGVAAIMAVMEDQALKHGELEGLITVDEETCMYGVENLLPDTLKGTILLNLDDETDGEMVIGSAGGVNVSASMEYKEVETDCEDVALKVSLKGLRGGHSGLEIAEGRANANKLMARFVREAVGDFEARLVCWNGGNMRNAIPRTCDVVMTIPAENKDELCSFVSEWLDTFKDEYAGIESDMTFTCEVVALPKMAVPEEIQDNLIDSIMACHNGVMRNIPSIPSIVETSSNLGIVNIGGGKADILVLARSSSDSMLDCIISTIESVFSMAGMKVELSGRYPAWQPNTASPIVKCMVQVYKDLFGIDNKVQVVHAGLECGVIGAKYPKMDMVSFGPTVRSPHTPDERCLISSVDRYYRFVVKTLEEVPTK